MQCACPKRSSHSSPTRTSCPRAASSRASAGRIAALHAQGARGHAPGTPVEPARRLHAGLRAEPAEEATGEQRGHRLGLTLAAHGPQGGARPSALEIHGGGEGVERALAGSERVDMAGVEGEEGAAVLEQDAGVARNQPRTVGVVERLDQRDHVAGRVGGDDGDGVAARGCRRRLGRHRAVERDAAAEAGQPRPIEQCRRRHRHGGGIGEVPVAVGKGELGRLHHHVDVVGFRERGEVETLDQPQQREERQALGRRRKARRDPVAIGNGQGLHPLRAMGGEVLGRQRAARRRRGGH